MKADQPTLFESVTMHGHTLASVPFSNASTSKQAARSVEKELPRLERIVYLAIAAAGARGLTCDECENVTALPHTTCSARISAMKHPDRRIIKDSGIKRPTSSGRNAIAWVVS